MNKYEYICTVCQDLSWKDDKEIESRCFVCDRPGILKSGNAVQVSATTTPAHPLRPV